MNYQKNASLNFQNIIINTAIPFIKKFPKIKNLESKIRTRRNDLHELISACDNVFIIADWFKKILEENGIATSALKKIPPFPKMISSYAENTRYLTKRKILFAGRIEKQKGLMLLCKAMNQLTTKQIKLDVFGDIIDENYYKECKAKFDFNYKGVLPRAELLILLKEYDFLVLPSVFTEMYSMILQESLYEHLPVIASNAKGNREMIKEGQNGFLFDYNNANDLAITIDNAYSLKQKLWKPVFEYSENPAKDIEEIISYYC